MSRTDMAFAMSALVIICLTWAAVSDLVSRRIPNLAVGLMVLIFAPWAWALGASLTSALAAGAIALAVGVALYAVRLMGAGDGKLFAACALFAGLGQLELLSAATALTGGAVAIGVFALQPTRTFVLLQMRGAGGSTINVPYGVAIACGGVWTVAHQLWVAGVFA